MNVRQLSLKTHNDILRLRDVADGDRLSWNRPSMYIETDRVCIQYSLAETAPVCSLYI